MNGDGGRHAWIREQLGWEVTDQEPIVVKAISQTGGAMGSVDRIRCGGRSFVFKGPPDDRSAWGNLLTDMGTREVRTYRLLETRGSGAPKVSPTCYWSALIGEGSGALALEDLGPTPGLGSTMAVGLTRNQALAAVRCLATAHASFAVRAGDARASPYPWLYTAESAGLIDAIRMGLGDLPHMMEDRWPGRFDQAAVRAILAVDVPGALERANVGAPFVSLCHGDAWAGNIVFVPAAPSTDCVRVAYVIDWQFAMWGNPLSDVAMLVMSSLTPSSRARWQRMLLDLYYATLNSHSRIDANRAEVHTAFRQVEPAAALVALATLDGFTAGMTASELTRFAPRVAAAIGTALDSAG
jgi:ecdysteroid kinase